MPFNPIYLEVYESPFPKKRLGQDWDGGYIICDIPNVNYNMLLSGGVGGDISFEEDFLKMYPNCKCNAYDGTISDININNKNITFIKKNIGLRNTDNETTLKSEIENNTDIVLKMDIEGAEVPWFTSLTRKEIGKFKQIIIEFHYPFSPIEERMFNEINFSFLLVHIHGNNNSDVQTCNNVKIPSVFECTYLNKGYFNNPQPPLNTEKLPSPLDRPNFKGRDDIDLNHWPFVHIL
jgi:hypothetical protein